jgi:CBS domain containing-hemolysin-like protein
MTSNLIYLLIFVGCVFLAGLFAGTETGIYQLSRLRLRLGVENKKLSFVMLSSSMRDSASLLISMLLGTNLAHYFATSGMTYLVLGVVETEHRAELLATLVSAPIFFIFSELIPKNLFFYRADNLMPAVSPVIYVFDRAARLCGITPILKKLSQIHRHIGRSETATREITLSTSRGYFETILMETHEEGMLSNTQAEMVRRLGRISDMPVSMVMTPTAKVLQVDVNSSKSDLLELCKKYAFTRYPVYEGWTGNVIGLINVYDCLTWPKDFTSLHNMVQPIRSIPPDTTVMHAIDIMQNEKEKMMLVAREGRRPVGVVTMKDLVEELLGELTEW